MAPTRRLRYDDVRPIKVNAPWGHFSGLCWGSDIDDEAAVKVLLVHGRQHNCESFSALIPLLPAQHFCYLCFDLPGHGQSSPHPPGLPLNFMQYIYSIKLFVDAIHWHKFIYIGHSMGGAMGCFFCAVFAERVMGFVALDSFIPDSIAASKCVEWSRRSLDNMLKLESRLKDNLSRNKYSLDEALVKIEHGPYGLVTAPTSRRILERSSKLDPSTALYTFTDDPRLKLELVPNLTHDQIRDVVSRLTCPTLLVIADQSIIKYRNDRNDAKVMQDHTRKLTSDMVIVNGDHFVHINNPNKVAPHICKFLNSLIFKSSL